MSDKKRPTKKQYELLSFIDEFIKEHGYSPSYREIMRGCNYTSVATVALHVGNLVKRGHLVKRDNSARSLEVIGSNELASAGVKDTPSNKVDHAKELAQEVEKRLQKLEKELSQEILDEVYVLVGALKVLGHDKHAYEYASELHKLK